MIDQNTASGIPQDAITLAMQSGYRPNPYASPWQQQQNLQQYLMMQKNIMDAQMGGPGGLAAKIAPGNPMAAMPFNMQNQFNAMQPLFNSPYAPTGSMAGGPGQGSVGGPGGFSFGALPNNMSPMLQATMQALQQGQQNQIPSQGDLSRLTPGNPSPVGAFGTPNSGQGSNPALPSGNQQQQGGGPFGGFGDITKALMAATPLGGLANMLPSGGGGQQNQQGSNVTVDTQNGPFPRFQALLAKRGGLNAIAPGVNPNDFIDNILVQALGGNQ